MHMKWYNGEQVKQWHRFGIIINNLKCQIGLHYCNGLVETIEMDISFAYFGVRTKEICTIYHVGPVGPTPGHVVTCCHTGVYVAMAHHRSKRSTVSTNQEQARRSKGPQPRDNWLETSQAPPYPPWDPLGTHLNENRQDWGYPGIEQPPGRSTSPEGLSHRYSTCRLVVTNQRQCQVPARLSLRNPAAPSHGRFTNSSVAHVTTSLVHCWHPKAA
jgi:hypothetical protein